MDLEQEIAQLIGDVYDIQCRLLKDTDEVKRINRTLIQLFNIVKEENDSRVQQRLDKGEDR